jgi:uncharacterized membrane protein
MRGPIDYIIVGFEGNNFKGEILSELKKAMDNGTIAVLDLALIVKDNAGNVEALELSSLDNEVVKQIIGSKSGALITDEDIEETGEVLENNTSAGLLIIEQLWAKGLKLAIKNANGVLVAEGRIHPDASNEINQKEGE